MCLCACLYVYARDSFSIMTLSHVAISSILVLLHPGQVILKPDPGNAIELYLGSLEVSQ